MRKLLAIILVVLQLLLCVNVNASDTKEDYVELLSEMIRKYDTDEYFSTMSVTIGEPNLLIDGESVPIDDTGSVAYVENGRTMMPVRGIAEAIGAEVSYEGETQTVKVENEDTVIALTIGDDEMRVNGEKVMLLSAPEIRDERTMLPVRDVAEALDCEVEWVQDTQTAIFTRDFQTKRIIIHSENAIVDGAVAQFSCEGKTVAQFDSIDDAKKCVEQNKSNGLVAEPDYIRTVDSLSWGVSTVGTEAYYSQTKYAVGSAVVAVIDTGIDYEHEMFSGRIYGGYDFYFNDGYCEDTQGHGTHVASTVIDVAGGNKNIKVMPLKVFGHEDSCASSTVAEAIKYATDNGANVINLSLGGQHRSEVEQEAIDYANSRNVTVVASAGNESIDMEHTEYSPGGLNGVITVSNVTQNLTLSGSSNYGYGVIEFGAPGTNIKGAKAGGGYCVKSGTSMAAPHVAGVYALVKSIHPNKTTDEITSALQKNATHKGNPKYFGAGIINADKLETYLSTMYYSDISVSNVTSGNAVVRGTVGYKGIIPQYIGVRLGTKDVYKIKYNANGNNEMNFVCDLNEDADYTLKSGTTYKCCIFTIQGGQTRVTDEKSFKTDKVETAPEPTPEPEPEPKPEPVVSELRILPNSYPSGEIKEGSKYNLSGRIKSNYHITDVRSYILDSKKSVLQESNGWTTTATYVIENSQLDTGLKFEKLKPGSYYVRYSASDESGKSISWTSDRFNVVANEPIEPVPPVAPIVPVEPTEVGVVLIPDSFENLSIRTGPSTNYDIIGSMNHTVSCVVYTNKTQNGWYYIEYNGIKGYAAGNYIYLKSETKTGTVSIPSSWDNLSIRTGPSTSYKIVGSMNHGKKCTIYPDKAKNGWYYVLYKGIYGYASGNCIK